MLYRLGTGTGSVATAVKRLERREPAVRIVEFGFFHILRYTQIKQLDEM
jgi:hypothetical protein